MPQTNSRPVGFLVAWLVLITACLVNQTALAGEHPSLVDVKSGEPIDLTPRRNRDTAWRVDARFEVGGDLTVAGEGKPKKLPMSVVARLAYEERLLETAPASPAPPALLSVRQYDKAEAVIKVGRGGVTSRLDPKAPCILVTRSQPSGAKSSALAPLSLFCPNAALTREELDLINIPGDSLVIDNLLPDEPVAVGQYWSHTPETIAALVGLEAVASCEVQSVVGQVKEGHVLISMAGAVQGATEGTATELELKANYLFDQNERRITRFNLAIKEKRPMGHVSPGVDVTSKLALRIQPLRAPEHLTDEVVAELSSTTAPETARLEYESPDGSFRLLHDDRWFVTNDQAKVVVLRRVDRGDLIAQCNLSPLAPVAPERHLTLEQFQKDVRFALGGRFEQFVAAGQRENEAGYREFRVAARGHVKDLPIQWNYYLLADRHGRRLSAVFTVDAGLVKQLGDADRSLVAGLTLLGKIGEMKKSQSQTADSRNNHPSAASVETDLPSAPEPVVDPTADKPSQAQKPQFHR